MPQPTWVLQKNLTNEKVFEAIKATLEADNLPYQEVLLIPFSDEAPVVKPPFEGLVFYGSTTLILNAWKDPKLCHGVFFDPARFSMENYLHQWGASMLNHDSRATTFESLAAESHPAEAAFFIRPDADSKAFSGQVMTFEAIQAFDAHLQDSENPNLDRNTTIVISLPKAIEKEWRSFVVDGKIVATSRYVLNGELDIDAKDVPAELLEFVQQAIDRYEPHAVFVIDTALSQGQLGILECNCFNGTGFYGHDIPKIVRAVNGWVQKQA